MEKIKIITDSTLDLPAELIREKNIEVLPLLINFGEESYLDGVEITTKEMIDKILFGTLPIKKKRIEIRKLANKGLERKFIKLFLKLLEYIEIV